MIPESHNRDLLAAGAAGAAFLLLARRAVHHEPSALDEWLHALAERLHHRGVEWAQLPLELAGMPGIYIPFAALVARAMTRRGRRGGRAIVTAASAGWIALRLTRLVYHRVRPPRPRHRGPKSESSFPSGHTIGITATAVAAARVLHRAGLISGVEARALGVGVPLMVGLHRAYVREHWATDVAGAWLLGTAIALAATAGR